MKTVKLLGKDINVVEHMKEIAIVCSEDQLFRRWYNRSQFFKAIIGKHVYNGNTEAYVPDEDEDDDFYGTCLGIIEGENEDCCWDIVLFDTETMTSDGLYDALEYAWDSFFMEDKNGKLYFVHVNVD